MVENLPEIKAIYDDAKARMEKSVENYKKELSKIRTGRASIALFEGIKVNYYGTMVPLNQVSTLSVPESRLIVIHPWETRMIPEIEKAIRQSDLGLSPVNDGRLIRVPFPPLTEERRRELVRVIKKMEEESKIAIRNIRRDANEQLKKLEKDKKISQDQLRREQEGIQALTDKYIKKVEELTGIKEKEIMEV